MYHTLTKEEMVNVQKRIEEKKAIEQMNIAEAVERLEMMESQDMD